MNEEVYQRLLETLTDQDSEADVEGLLLQQLGDTNPALKLVAQHLAQRRKEETQDEPFFEDEIRAAVPEDSYPEEGLKSDRPDRILSFRRLRQLVENMYEELDELRQRNDALAEALGACYLCWGEDRDCEVCQGRGQPGASTPDRELFAQYIAPALRRLRKQEEPRKEGRNHE